MPKWTTLPEASTACNELLHWGCKKSCQGLCKYFRAKLFFVLVQDTAADKNIIKLML